MIKTKKINQQNGNKLVIDYGLRNDQYFSITGLIYDYNVKGPDKCILGGCIHDEILKECPEFSDLVNLHLSDKEGQPMHAIDNGFYYYQMSRGFAAHYKTVEGDKERLEKVLMEHLRTSEQETAEILRVLDKAMNCGDKKFGERMAKKFFEEYIIRELRPRWQIEATAAIKKYDL